MTHAVCSDFQSLESAEKANKILAMPFLAVIALFVCCYSAINAADVAYLNRHETKIRPKKQVVDSFELCKTAEVNFNGIQNLRYFPEIKKIQASRGII